MIVLLWITLIVSVLVVVLATTVRARLMVMARNGKSGSEIIAIALAPLFLASFLFSYAGGVSGLLLAAFLDGTGVRVTTGVLGSLLLLTGLAATAGFFRGWRSSRRLRRELAHVISQDEMLELIRTRAVTGFSKQEDGRVQFQYAAHWDDKGNYLYRTTNADPQGYPAYVAAANAIRRQDGHVITYHNRHDPHDPLSPGARWVSLEEATALLDADEIKTFSYGTPSVATPPPNSGDPTGITLLDHGWVRHLTVDHTMEAAMIPIARAAQRRHGRPQFSINGRYERTASTSD